MKKIVALLISFCIIFIAGCQNETATNSETNVTDTKHNSAPYIISVMLDELKDIRNAVNSMQEDDFKEYMYENHYGAIVNGMNTIEKAKVLMEEFEETTIPVLDGDAKNVSKLLLYRDSNCIHNLIIYDSEEIQRTSVLVYTVNHTEANAMNFTEDVEFISTKNIENNRYTAKLYETNIEDCKFFGEIEIDGSYIILRSGGIETLEEFEKCFSRLEFRKIGDLLNEIPVETPKAEITEENLTVPEELYPVETTANEEIPFNETPLPDQTESVTTE